MSSTSLYCKNKTTAIQTYNSVFLPLHYYIYCCFVELKKGFDHFHAHTALNVLLDTAISNLIKLCVEKCNSILLPWLYLLILCEQIYDTECGLSFFLFTRRIFFKRLIKPILWICLAVSLNALKQPWNILKEVMTETINKHNLLNVMDIWHVCI